MTWQPDWHPGAAGRMSRRAFLERTLVASAVGALGLGTYTWRFEPHWLQVVSRDLPVAGLPPSLAGATLVQLSDLHVGPDVDDDYILDTFARVAALQPDIVVVTGDFLTYRRARGDAQYVQLRNVLARVPRGRRATIGVLGNHDYGYDWGEPAVAARVAAEAGRAGVHVLRNEVAAVDGLDVIGVDDLWARAADPMKALGARANDAAIVLCHNPDTLDLRPWGDYRGWVLSGHTHGGQCKPPFLPAPMLPVQNTRYSAGAVDVGDGRQVYVNRGVGHLTRVRFNVRPEVTVFTLRPASAVGRIGSAR